MKRKFLARCLRVASDPDKSGCVTVHLDGINLPPGGAFFVLYLSSGNEFKEGEIYRVTVEEHDEEEAMRGY